ncbi:hypothetical protein EDD11_008814 [Mortierella claussenii]|nr:hypothetical protein EDD11_008814 [Mortierella claussenii]
MSLDTDIRRDANPTPTRFLLECGAFTPGFGLSFENYNPFDASLKIFNTGTPKAELNPFDSSFRAPTTTVSVKSSSNGASHMAVQGNEKQKQRNAFERHPWADIMFDEVTMPMPQMSPGLSPSSSSTSASPSPPICSPPPQTISLTQFHPSMAIDPNVTHTLTYDRGLLFDAPSTPKQFSSDVSPDACTQVVDHQKPEHHADSPFSSHIDEDEEDEELEELNHEVNEYEAEHDQELDAAMSALDMRRYSTMSDIQQPLVDEAIASGRKNGKVSKTPKTTAKSKKAQAAASAADVAAISGRKPTAKGAKSRKRSSTEEETPELKRQKFLERNRMAASKCREKKRLQTLKTISDADEITARNQALHETLDQLQEEVRRLKNQILCHRDCGCDVIQKFVKTSFNYSAVGVSSPTSLLMPSPYGGVPPSVSAVTLY